jgi:hypothetical protein
MKQVFIFAIVLSGALISTFVQAIEPQKSNKLTCSGIYRYYGDGGGHLIAEINIKGIFLEILSNKLKIIGLPKFSLHITGSIYNISTKNEQAIHFKNPAIIRQNGILNRISGELNLSETVEGSTNMSAWFVGSCVPYRTMF